MGKLLKALQQLTRKEFQAFSRYMYSPYFCQHAETIRLFETLAPHFPGFSVDLLGEMNASTPDRTLTSARLHVLKTYLYQHLLDFKVQQQLAARPLLRTTLLTDRLRQEENFKGAEKQLAAARKQHLSQEALDSSHYAKQLQLEELGLDLALSQDNRSGELSLHAYFRALDEHYLGLNLKYLLPALTVNRLFNQEFPVGRWAEIKAKFLARSTPGRPLTRIFFHLMLLLQDEAPETQLTALGELLRDHATTMSKVELMNVYGYLQNHFTQQAQRGVAEALSRLFAVFQEMAQHELIFGRGEISGHFIRNIAVVGCRLGRLKWTRNFLETHRADIQQELGGNAYAFSRAYLDFYFGDYQKALGRLQALEFVDPFYRTGHQVLLLRIYYELGDFLAMNALLDTFRRYLNRTKAISDTRKDVNRRFISVLRQLGKARETGPTPEHLQKIRLLLDENTGITDRTWLTAKWRELQTPTSSKSH
ncbi:MAG: hypothetical protein AAF998_01060 [Bacteroidota bacterium]